MLDLLRELFDKLRDLPALVQWAGYVGVTAIIFVETGTLFFFLPGDSLLVTAGLVAAQPSFGLNVWWLGLLCSVAAIVGDTISYTIGRTLGPRLFTKTDSFLFNQKHLKTAHAFYEKHGGKTIVLARFVPIIRTFAPVVAGAAQMQYRSFVFYNVTGGLAWIWSMLLLGYWLGSVIPGLDKQVDKLAIVIVFISILPILWEWYKERRRAAASAS
ncbi:MAG: VTT domain-containing protein [Gemmatimonadaceae bacterium]|nr:VTT domain-containing protein [Gemmatimonadaceae bacterium]